MKISLLPMFYHGSYKIFKNFDVDHNTGAFFTTDQKYAKHYGPYIYRCRVTLKNPQYEEQGPVGSGGGYGNARLILIEDGYDGRVLTYYDGAKDVIAFYPEQIKILSMKG